MIKGKVNADLKKLWNLYRKANSVAKKAVAPIGKQVLAAAKADVPIDSGALKKSLASKPWAKKGVAMVIVGPRVNYSREIDGVVKIPNKYSGKVDESTGFLSDQLNDNVVNQMRQSIAAEIKQILGGS